MKKVLFIDACVRKESRTKILADYLLKRIDGEIEEINLNKDKPTPFDEALLEKREALLSRGDFKNEMFSYAQKFANADEIVIAAPLWDFSFPALFKTFIEHVNVGGIVFKYNDEGIQSLCKASKLYYVTTMGGYNPTDFGFGYVKALCNTLYGIKDVALVKAEGLDIIGNDVQTILEKAKKEIDVLIK